MSYRYDLHCHTSEGSKCSVLSAQEMAEFYHRRGYSGFCVTDHFSGNGPLPDDTPWGDRVEFYHDIYSEAKKAGEKFDLSVFFGLEYSLAPDVGRLSKITGNDFLILNLSKEWLTENKAAFSGKFTDLFAKIREAGGFVIHAHPFLEERWVESIRLYPRHIDAVEVLNSGGSDFLNENALAYARAYGLLEVAGSDCHSPAQKVLGGIETDAPCLTAAELVAAIREKKTRLFKTEG